MNSRTRPRWKRCLLKLWREWGKPLLIVLVVLGSFRSAVADWNDVPTGSMKPTILEGDRIFVNKLAYGLRFPFTDWWIAKWSAPRRGDVVICFSPANGDRLVKRVIGVPGDRIEMRANRLVINGRAVTFKTLPTDVINQIDEDDRPMHRFAAEWLDERVHAVMWTPGRPARRSFAPVTVPPGRYFVMGDNRDNSADSRFFGFVERNEIVGRSTATVLSLDRDKYYLPRWDRFFRALP
ncbi:MAG: signal peptidase I [Planctomycetes bacterium]|nr:signal peptidase I [Planctomycetota bacterium]